MKIRDFQIKDSKKVAEIEKASFSLPWSEEALEGAGLQENCCFLVGVSDEDEDDILCYASFISVLDEAEIPFVCVRADNRGKGIGTLLMNALVHRAKALGITQMFLEVRVSNINAIGLYEKTGFVKTGLRKGFYSSPKEDGYVMQLTID